MTSRRRLRMRIEIVLAIVFALLGVATIMDPQWIEQMLRFDPDYGSGEEANAGLAVGFWVASLVASLLAWRDWRFVADPKNADDQNGADYRSGFP